MKRKLLSLLLVLAVVVAYGSVAAYALPGDTDENEDQYYIIDDFNRDVRYDERVTTKGTTDDEGTPGTIFWMQDSGINYNANGDFDIVDGALHLDYTDKGWYGMGCVMNAKDFDYLCIRIKGAKGGENDNMYMAFADGTMKKVAGNRFNNFVTADGGHPQVTTEWSTVVIDMNKSEIVNQGEEDNKDAYFTIDKGFLAIHFNFDAPGSVDIDCIWLSNDKSGEVPQTKYLEGKPDGYKEATPTKADDNKEATTVKADDNKDDTDKDAAATTVAEKKDNGGKSFTFDDKTIFFIILGAAVVVVVVGIVVATTGKKKK